MDNAPGGKTRDAELPIGTQVRTTPAPLSASNCPSEATACESRAGAPGPAATDSVSAFTKKTVSIEPSVLVNVACAASPCWRNSVTEALLVAGEARDITTTAATIN